MHMAESHSVSDVRRQVPVSITLVDLGMFATCCPHSMERPHRPNVKTPPATSRRCLSRTLMQVPMQLVPAQRSTLTAEGNFQPTSQDDAPAAAAAPHTGSAPCGTLVRSPPVATCDEPSAVSEEERRSVQEVVAAADDRAAYWCAQTQHSCLRCARCSQAVSGINVQTVSYIACRTRHTLLLPAVPAAHVLAEACCASQQQQQHGLYVRLQSRTRARLTHIHPSRVHRPKQLRAGWKWLGTAIAATTTCSPLTALARRWCIS